MKVGFVTDTHLGTHDKTGNDKVRETYTDILNSFEKQDVDTVVHLGDCVDERSNTDLEDLADSITGELSRFENAFVAPGNHDAIELDRSDFQTDTVDTPPVELFSSNNHSVLLLETAMDVEYKNVGRLSDSSIELLEDRLESGYDLTLLTHYPLDYTDAGSAVFDFMPERKFPVNKIDLREMQNRHSGNITAMFCGHLHPDSTAVIEGSQSLDSNMVVVEPITAISVEDGDVEVSVNESTEPEELIFDI